MTRLKKHLTPKLSTSLLSGAVLVLASACYSGVDRFDSQAQDSAGLGDSGTNSNSGSGSGGDSDGSDSDGGGDQGDPFIPDPGQIRLLSPPELTNTLHDLLGVEVDAEFNYSDAASGYDNSSNGQVDENLLSILYVEVERVAAEYVATKLPQEFPCFVPGGEVTSSCAEDVINDLGRRAYRRPLTDAQRTALTNFVAATEVADSSTLMSALVTRMLMSPHFLYRTEIGTVRGEDPKVALLDPYERASLISYALTGTMPDNALLADAEAGQLQGDTIRDHVHRLLDTPQGRAQITSFFKQWLRVGALDAIAARPEEYPKFSDPATAQALRGEFATFIDQVVIEDGATFSELLTHEATYVNRHTAALYGSSSEQDEFEPLALEDGERGGVLTLASVMAVHSSSSEIPRDKPIRRGLLIKNQFQCEDIGLPSGIDVASAADGVLDQVDDFDALTTREQFELIMNQDELCVACHVQFMPFGYLWSNFDGLGQLQTHYGDRLLDSAVNELTVDGELQSFDGIMDLLPTLAESPQASECFSTNVVRFASGMRDSRSADLLSEELATPLREGDVNIIELFEEILTRPELYMREAP